MRGRRRECRGRRNRRLEARVAHVDGLIARVVRHLEQLRRIARQLVDLHAAQVDFQGELRGRPLNFDAMRHDGRAGRIELMLRSERVATRFPAWS